MIIGKSTILKLIARIYDPSEGEILIDGRNIRTLRLEDLRAAISVLFQDYTHFPLSVIITSILSLLLIIEYLCRSKKTLGWAIQKTPMMKIRSLKLPDSAVQTNSSIGLQMDSTHTSIVLFVTITRVYQRVRKCSLEDQ